MCSTFSTSNYVVQLLAETYCRCFLTAAVGEDRAISLTKSLQSHSPHTKWPIRNELTSSPCERRILVEGKPIHQVPISGFLFRSLSERSPLLAARVLLNWIARKVLEARQAWCNLWRSIVSEVSKSGSSWTSSQDRVSHFRLGRSRREKAVQPRKQHSVNGLGV